MKRKPRIYLKRTISADDPSIHETDAIVSTIPPHADVANPHLLGGIDQIRAYEQEWKQQEIQAGRNASVATRDENLILGSDAVIGIVRDSYGQGYEGGWSLLLGKPSLELHRPEFRSLMLRDNEHPSLTRVEYRHAHEAQESIRAFVQLLKESMDPGILVSFEGIDCCGKTTQIELAHAYLVGRGLPVTVSREPGGTSLGEAIREITHHPEETYPVLNLPFEDRDPLAEAFLYFTSRAEFSAKVVLPDLRQGKVVIADRYADSTRAYQGGGRFRNDPMKLRQVDMLNSIAIQGRWPDLTFYLRIPYETMRERAGARPSDYMESLGQAFFEGAIAGYDMLAVEQQHRIVTVDGRKREDEIFDEDIRPRLESLLGEMR